MLSQWPTNGKRVNKAAWHILNDQPLYFRSLWEYRYALYLEWLRYNNSILGWAHEPKTFWFESIKRGVRSYLPDFQVIDNDGTTHWVEVKGYYDARSLTKIKRFRKYYPKETLLVVDGAWFKRNGPKLRSLLKGWNDAGFSKRSNSDGRSTHGVDDDGSNDKSKD